MKNKNKKGFSLMELIIVIAIIGILSGAAYIGIQKVQSRNMNDKVLDDLIAISNAMEQYKRDHFGEFPMPSTGGNMNLNCFYADATYAHDCDAGNTAFVQGMIDNNLLSKRYLQEVPTDPRTGSRYVYGVTTDKQYFQVAGNFLESNGTWVAKTVGNLAKGYHLPSVVRAYNGPNFVVENGSNLPYSPDHQIVTAKLHNVVGTVKVNGSDVSSDGMVVHTGERITTDTNSSVDVYYSDGSVSNLDENSEMEILSDSSVEQNDADGIMTKIKVKLFSGKIWNKVARLASQSEFNIATTSAIAGVRGTEFGMEITDEDTGTANVLLTIGEICLGDDSVDIVDCIGGTIVIVEPGESAVTKDMTGTAATPSLELTELKEQQAETFYLNDNIRPHILGIEAGTVTVSNLKDYYGVEHDIQVTKLSAYADITTSPDFEIDITSTGGGDYIMSSVAGDNLVFRFEDDEGNVSGFSEPPITIDPNTVLTEEEIYGGEVEKDIESETTDCTLEATYPVGDFVTVPTAFNWVWSSDDCIGTEGVDYYTIVLMKGTSVVKDYTVNDENAISTEIIDYTFLPDAYKWVLLAKDNSSNTIGSAIITNFNVQDLTAGCTTGHTTTQDCTGVANGTSIETFVCDEYGEWPASAACELISCDAGYDMNVDTCQACTTAPSNASHISGCEWVCDDGYELNAALDGCISKCGDGIVVGGEECDGGTGCVTDCTCNSGYIANDPVGVDCVEPLITLLTPEPPTTIAIDSDLTWGVSPTYAFDGAVYSLTINSTNVTGNTNTFLSLAGITSPTITSGSTYTWEVTAFNGTTPIAVSDTGSFDIEEAAPAITYLAIDCTTCMTEDSYTVSFTVTDATSCTAISEVLSPGTGGSGDPSSVTINPDDTASFTFDTTGTESLNTIQITVSCDGSGGPAIPESIDVYLAF